MRHLTPMALAMLQACASSPPMWTPAARTTVASCAAPGAPAAPSWQLVTADGFTFCVPADWRSADGRTWHSADGSVTWGTGIPGPRDVVTGSVIVLVPVGGAGAMPSPSAMQSAANAQMRERCSNDRFAEKVGGRSATLFDNECDGRHNTGAQWGAPAVYFRGEAGDAATASLQLQVYRSTRFVSATGP